MCEYESMKPEMWNNRPIEDALRAEVERLREAVKEAAKYIHDGLHNAAVVILHDVLEVKP